MAAALLICGTARAAFYARRAATARVAKKLELTRTPTRVSVRMHCYAPPPALVHHQLWASSPVIGRRSERSRWCWMDGSLGKHVRFDFLVSYMPLASGGLGDFARVIAASSIRLQRKFQALPARLSAARQLYELRRAVKTLIHSPPQHARQRTAARTSKRKQPRGSPSSYCGWAAHAAVDRRTSCRARHSPRASATATRTLH